MPTACCAASGNLGEAAQHPLSQEIEGKLRPRHVRHHQVEHPGHRLQPRGLRKQLRGGEVAQARKRVRPDRRAALLHPHHRLVDLAQPGGRIGLGHRKRAEHRRHLVAVGAAHLCASACSPAPGRAGRRRAAAPRAESQRRSAPATVASTMSLTVPPCAAAHLLQRRQREVHHLESAVRADRDVEGRGRRAAHRDHAHQRLQAAEELAEELHRLAVRLQGLRAPSATDARTAPLPTHQELARLRRGPRLPGRRRRRRLGVGLPSISTVARSTPETPSSMQ